MKYFFLIVCMLLSAASSAGRSVELTVESGAFPRKDCVVTFPLSEVGLEDAAVALYELKNGRTVPVDSQVLRKKGGKSLLCWILSGETPADTRRNFLVKTRRRESRKGIMQVEDNSRALLLKRGEDPVLQYNYTVTYPPAGVDTVYRRSGFIHPAYSPSGNVLTNIQPRDHFHHYGIWNPWTRVEYDGKVYDLWNLKDRQGTVRADAVEECYQGRVCAGYRAALDHIAFTAEGEKKVIDEDWTLRCWNIPEGFLWDFESDLYPCGPVTIKAYRYGGFSMRATSRWTKPACRMMTSEGKERNEIDGTTARWIWMSGECGDRGRSGILIMSHPGNFGYPEPLRVWNERMMHKTGEAFVNYAPTKYQDWKLEAGQVHRLRYRIYTYDGEITKEEAERLWNDFAHPPVVKAL